MPDALSVKRSGITTFARYRNVKSGSELTAVSTVSGGILYADSTYYYRVFLANGTLSVSTASLSADILVIAGGGSGGSYYGGGGGAGGLVSFVNQSLQPSTYPVTVGAGGAGSEVGNNGSNSQFSQLTAAVGGGHGGQGGGGAAGPATSGGSGGGGGSSTASPSTLAGGAGTSGQGFAGGNSGGMAGSYPSGGGGGAGGVGETPATSTSNGGSGGPGLGTFSTWLAATKVGVNGFIAGGGGGEADNKPASAGGSGGGGNSGTASGGVTVTSPTAGAVNTGSGGGGGATISTAVGGAGGSGVVIVRYLKTSAMQSTPWQTDSLSGYLKLSLPLSETLGINDYSATISSVGTNRTTSQTNSPTLQTTVSKYYGSSLYMGNYSDNKYISTPTNANLQIGTNDFTIEGWYYFTNNSVSGGYQCLASHAGDSSDQQPGWVMILEANTTFAFYACTAGSSGWGLAITTSTTPTTNTWHHVSVTRSSGVVRMFLNGTQIGTTTSSNNIGVPSSQTLRVGSYQYFPGPVAKGLSGYIQDFRLYIGAAKYTSNFTPPSQMYTGG